MRLDKRSIPGRRRGEQRLSLAKRLLFSGLLLLVFDVALAQLMKLFPAGNARASEQQYRISHDVYHHDLRKSFRGPSLWGSRVFTIHTNSLGFKDREVREIPLKSDIGATRTSSSKHSGRDCRTKLPPTRKGANAVSILRPSRFGYAGAFIYRGSNPLVCATKADFSSKRRGTMSSLFPASAAASRQHWASSASKKSFECEIEASRL